MHELDDRTQAALDAIADRLACPMCTYSLRGLEGDVVDCPECGASVDVAVLAHAAWDKPWYDAPGLTRLAHTTAWAAAIVPLMCPITLALKANVPAAVLVIVALWVVVWMVLAVRCARQLGAKHAAWMLTVLHLIVVGQLLVLVAGIGAVFYASLKFTHSPWLGVVVAAVLFAGAVELYLLSLKGERFLCRACLRLYFRHASMISQPHRESGRAGASTS